jgi:hypothetical protein
MTSSEKLERVEVSCMKENDKKKENSLQIRNTRPSF